MKASLLLLATTLATSTLYVVSRITLGLDYPASGSHGNEIIAWFSENGTCARTFAWLSTFISLGFIVIGGLVATVLPRPHGYIFLGGAIGFAITTQIQAWFWAGLALHPHELDPGTARVLFGISAYWDPVVNASMVAMAAPVAALGFSKAPIVPSWLTWISVIFSAEQIFETVTIFGRSGFIAPGGAMNVVLGSILSLVFLIGLLIWAMKRLDETADMISIDT